jgi:hypothetical protein
MLLAPTAPAFTDVRIFLLMQPPIDAGSHSLAADTLPRCDASLFKFFRRNVQGVPASHECGEADGKLQKNIHQSAVTFS